MSADPAFIAASLTPTQWHVMSRCSTGSWASDEGRGFPRRWYDLVHGRRGSSFRSIAALVRRGLLYEDERGGGIGRSFGLTPLGFSVLDDRPR